MQRVTKVRDEYNRELKRVIKNAEASGIRMRTDLPSLKKEQKSTPSNQDVIKLD